MNVRELRSALEAGTVVHYLAGIGRNVACRIVRVDSAGGAPARVDIQLLTGAHVQDVTAARISPAPPTGGDAA